MSPSPQEQFDAWVLRSYRAGHSAQAIADKAAEKFPAISSRFHIHAALGRAIASERAAEDHRSGARPALPEADEDGSSPLWVRPRHPIAGARPRATSDSGEGRRAHPGSPRDLSQLSQEGVDCLGHGHRFVGDRVVVHADDLRG